MPSVKVEIPGLGVQEFEDQATAASFMSAYLKQSGSEPPQEDAESPIMSGIKAFGEAALKGAGPVGEGLFRAGQELVEGKPSLGAAIHGASDSVLLGQGPRIAGALLPGYTKEDIEARRAKLAQESPKSYDLGYMLGSPVSPLGQVIGGAKTLGPLASTAVNAIGNVIEGQAGFPQTVEDTPMNRLKAGATDLIGASILPGLLKKGYKGAPALPGTYRPDLNVEVFEAQRGLANATGSPPVPLALDDLTKSPLQDTIGRVLRQTPFARGKFRELGEKGAEQVYSMLDQANPKLGRQTITSPDGLTQKPLPSFVPEGSISNQIVSAANARNVEIQQRFEPIYRQLDAEVSPIRVKEGFGETAKVVQNWMDGATRKEFSTASQQTLEKLLNPSEARGGVYDGFGEMKPLSKTINFTEAHNLRKELNQIISQSQNGKAVRAAYDVKQALDRDFEALGNNLPEGNSFQKVKQVIADYREQKQALDIPLIAEIERAVKDVDSPFETGAFNKLLGAAKAKRVGEIDRTISLLSPEGKQAIQDRLFQHFTRGKSDEYDIFGGQPGIPDSNPLVRRLQGFDKDTLTPLVGENNANMLLGLKKLAPYMTDALEAQKSPKNPLLGSAGLGLAGTLGGTIARSTGATLAQASGATLGTMGAALQISQKMAKHFTDPEIVVKLMKIGKHPTGSRELTKLATTIFKQTLAEDNPESQKQPLGE